jgi:hypothetical protein
MTNKPNEIDPDARIHDDEEPVVGVSDYGTLSVPPSDVASTILSAMTQEEKANFNDLLGHLQAWSESACGTPGLLLHPQARASLWGAALAKMADHFRETGRNDRALFFVGAAWNISKHPLRRPPRRLRDVVKALNRRPRRCRWPCCLLRCKYRT